MTLIVNYKTGNFSHWIGKGTKWWSLFNLKSNFIKYVLSKNYLNKELSKMKNSILGCQCDHPNCGQCEYARVILSSINLSEIKENMPVF